MPDKRSGNVKFKIRGIIAISFDGQLTVSIRPAHRYLSPDEKYGVAFPLDGAGQTAMLLEIFNGVFDLKVPEIRKDDYILALVAAAGSQRAVDLTIDDGRQVVAVKFPVD